MTQVALVGVRRPRESRRGLGLHGIALLVRDEVVERTFDEVVSDLCGTVAAVTDELEDESRGSSCRPFESPHVLTSQRHKDLAGRTTPEAAACASKELRPSAYAWMLDLGRRHRPPRNASR